MIGTSVAQILNLDSNCGKGTPLRRKRIVGGNFAAETHHGWQVIIKENNRLKCGGSLINKYWVLTAASCVYRNLNPSSYTLEFGVNDMNAKWSTSKNFRRKGKKIFIHPSYDSRLIRNDIALIKLDKSVSKTSSYNVVSVCVPDGRENYQNKYGYATGFGAYDLAGVNNSARKLQVNLPILTDSQCSAKFGSSLIDTYTQVCAGRNNEGKDTCARDTGGPLVARGNNGRWHLVGITSWGRNPCGNGGVFTRVSAYSAYIKDIIARN